MEPARQQSVNLKSTNLKFLRGSIRTRFVLGTATLMAVVLAGLIGVVTTHARVRLQEQMHDALRTMVAWNAGMIELGLPDDAETLDFDTLMAGMTANGLVDFIIADRDNVVLISLDRREIGVGINTGMALAGAVGPKERLDLRGTRQPPGRVRVRRPGKSADAGQGGAGAGVGGGGDRMTRRST